MYPRSRPLVLWLTILALPLGGVAGALIGRLGSMPLAVKFAFHVSELGGVFTLASMQALAVPVVLSSIILGATGLEPMRQMPALVRKAGLWMVGATFLAVLSGMAVAWVFTRRWSVFPDGHEDVLRRSFYGWTDLSRGSWAWLGLVFVALAFGYYRNQLDEGRGRLITRLCSGLEEMLAPLLRVVRTAISAGIFTLAMAQTLLYGSFKAWPVMRGAFHCAELLVAAGAVYVLLLALGIRLFARIALLKQLGALAPAMLLAATGFSVEAALPLTMDAVRRRAGVSNRVAGVTISLCGVLQRDGAALGWAAVGLALDRGIGGGGGWMALVAIGAMAMLVGCGLHALAARAPMMALIFLELEGSVMDKVFFASVIEAMVASLGAAVSVFSHACAAIVIARSEGEYWVPGPPPTSDEVQRLKADLQASDE